MPVDDRISAYYNWPWLILDFRKHKGALSAVKQSSGFSFKKQNETLSDLKFVGIGLAQFLPLHVALKRR